MWVWNCTNSYCTSFTWEWFGSVQQYCLILNNCTTIPWKKILTLTWTRSSSIIVLKARKIFHMISNVYLNTWITGFLRFWSLDGQWVLTKDAVCTNHLQKINHYISHKKHEWVLSFKLNCWISWLIGKRLSEWVNSELKLIVLTLGTTVPFLTPYPM
jgi:hypothetical protein